MWQNREPNKDSDACRVKKQAQLTYFGDCCAKFHHTSKQYEILLCCEISRIFMATRNNGNDTMTEEHDTTAQNALARKLLRAVAANDKETYQQCLAERRAMFETEGIKRYTRRLSDKLLWSVEQALEMGLNELAMLLVVITEEALDAEDNITANFRGSNNPTRPTAQGTGIDPNPPEYTRRLSDKLIWAIEQSVDQGKMNIAGMLKPLYEVSVAGAEQQKSIKAK